MSIITLKNKIINDEYTEYVYNSYDIQNKEESITEIKYNLKSINNFDWNIGIILGNSGSGKTTILKEIGEIKDIQLDNNKPLISNFDWLTPQEASKLLTSMGLSSIPSWLRPYKLLSNGEQYRAKMAYIIGSSKTEDIILIDEFTSVVDRNVAKAMSYSIQKYIRKNNKKIIIASCHYDILEWLMPDWTCSLEKEGMLEKHDYLRQGRPKIQLQVSRVEIKVWDMFKKHHYLTENINKSSKLFLFEWGDKPVGIVATINKPFKGMPNAYGLSRTVVLPDYQGLGIGSKISEFVCGIITNDGGICYTKTVNPALGEYRNKSENWIPTAYNMKSKSIINNKLDRIKYRNRVTRISYCHKYIGKKINGYEELLKPIDEMRTLHYQTTLF